MYRLFTRDEYQFTAPKLTSTIFIGSDLKKKVSRKCASASDRPPGCKLFYFGYIQNYISFTLKENSSLIMYKVYH